MYSTQLLEAIGEWQNGWREDAVRRIAITDRLRTAIVASGLPVIEWPPGKVCYRKRYLVPNNPQNGADLEPLLIDGRIDEGIASWTTSLDYAKEFKDPLRQNEISTVFGHVPTTNEVLLNIERLWSDADFVNAVKTYTDGQGQYAGALNNFRALQHEVILDAPLLLEDVEAFCGPISDFDHLCEVAPLKTERDQEDFWRRMVHANILPGDPRWLDREKSQRVLMKVRTMFLERRGK